MDLVCGFEFMRCGCEFVVVSFAFGCWAGAVCFAAGGDLDWIVWQVCGRFGFCGWVFGGFGVRLFAWWVLLLGVLWRVVLRLLGYCF